MRYSIRWGVILKKTEVFCVAKSPRLTKDKVDKFIELAMLSEDEIYILQSRMRGTTVTEQALYLGKCESSVNKMIRVIKDKYDMIRDEYPELNLPKRYKSQAEMYMDTH